MMLPTDDFAGQALYKGTALSEKSVVENYLPVRLRKIFLQAILQVRRCTKVLH